MENVLENPSLMREVCLFIGPLDVCAMSLTCRKFAPLFSKRNWTFGDLGELTTLAKKTFNPSSFGVVHLSGAIRRVCTICDKPFRGKFDDVFNVYAHPECVDARLVRNYKLKLGVNAFDTTPIPIKSVTGYSGGRYGRGEYEYTAVWLNDDGIVPVHWTYTRERKDHITFSDDDVFGLEKRRLDILATKRSKVIETRELKRQKRRFCQLYLGFKTLKMMDSMLCIHHRLFKEINELIGDSSKQLKEGDMRSLRPLRFIFERKDFDAGIFSLYHRCANNAAHASYEFATRARERRLIRLVESVLGVGYTSDALMLNVTTYMPLFDRSHPKFLKIRRVFHQCKHPEYVVQYHIASRECAKIAAGKMIIVHVAFEVGMIPKMTWIRSQRYFSNTLLFGQTREMILENVVPQRFQYIEALRLKRDFESRPVHEVIERFQRTTNNRGTKRQRQHNSCSCGSMGSAACIVLMCRHCCKRTDCRRHYR